MILSAKEILDKGLIIQNGFGQPAQVGIDLSVCKITQIQGNSFIGVARNSIPQYIEVETDTYLNVEETEFEGWNLAAGVYSLTFNEGIALDTNHCGKISNRSSIQRSCGLIESGQFDPGFSCDNIGATLFVFAPIMIEKDARLAQIVISENNPAEAYNGQYQGDKDKK